MVVPLCKELTLGKERARGRMLVVLLAVLALIAAACGGGGDEDGDAGGSEGAGGGGGEVSGSVTLLTALTEEVDINGLQAVIDAFKEQYPEAEIQQEGSPSFEEQALTRVEGGSPPEMMLIPQPGLMKDFFDRGAALPLDFLDRAALEEEYVPGVLQAGTLEDQLVGLPVRLQVKSLVWYLPQVFEENGYEVPETWEDMVALTDQIRTDLGGQGTSPWCVGIEDSTATGWALTDWIEDVMLRLNGGEAYDEWVGHALEFQSPEVTAAFEEVGNLWFPEGNVLGGPQNIVQTSFSAAPEPMFEDPPACLMHRQAGFVQGIFPEDLQFGTDYDFFPLPPIEAGTGENAVLTAGDLLVAFEDNPVVQAFAEFVATTEAQEAWAESGAFLCANANCDPSLYPDEATAGQGEMLANADVARFDASDLMPSQVGAGAFWNEGTAWVAGEQELEPTLQAIDAAWPEGACGVGGVGPNCAAGAATSSEAAGESEAEAAGAPSEATSE
jgi:alpha-glucoside transport system substrate-binding protein